MKLLNRINFISESRKHQSIEGYIATLRKLVKKNKKKTVQLRQTGRNL